MLSGWGDFVDPAGDCTASLVKGKLRIKVPGTHHNLNPGPQYNLLAPRVWQEVDGDFQAQVTVAAFPRPEKNTSNNSTKVSYIAAGLVAWHEGKSFFRWFRAANAERGELFVHYEGFSPKGRGKTLQKKRDIPDEATFLRVERKGNDFKFAWSADGQTWTNYAEATVEGWPAKLKVGVAAVNGTTKKFAPQFEGLKIGK